MKLTKLINGIIIFFAFTTINVASSNPNQEQLKEPTKDQYQVEVIIFEHQKQDVSNELWPSNPSFPDLSNTVEIEKLESNNLMLNDALNRLKKRGLYKILLHEGWVQTLNSKEAEIPVLITAGKSFEPSNPYEQMAKSHNELEGTITFKKKRYLHVETDLAFTKPMQVVEQSNQQMVKLAKTRNNSWHDSYNSNLHTFRLQEKRKLKLNEVQYIDHPIFGVLVLVSRYNG